MQVLVFGAGREPRVPWPGAGPCPGAPKLTYAWATGTGVVRGMATSLLRRAKAALSDGWNRSLLASQRKNVTWIAVGSIVTTLNDTGRSPRDRVDSVPAVETTTLPSRCSTLS